MSSFLKRSDWCIVLSIVRKLFGSQLKRIFIRLESHIRMKFTVGGHDKLALIRLIKHSSRLDFSENIGYSAYSEELVA